MEEEYFIDHRSLAFKNDIIKKVVVKVLSMTVNLTRKQKSFKSTKMKEL